MILDGYGIFFTANTRRGRSRLIPCLIVVDGIIMFVEIRVISFAGNFGTSLLLGIILPQAVDFQKRYTGLFG